LALAYFGAARPAPASGSVLENAALVTPVPAAVAPAPVVSGAAQIPAK